MELYTYGSFRKNIKCNITHSKNGIFILKNEEDNI